MARFSAFLRGMNLGNRRITNAELVSLFEEMGFSEVEAFLASGNVAFTATGSAKILQPKIVKALRSSLNYDVPTFLRQDSALVRIAAADPFKSKKAKGPRGKLQVAFLPQVPAKAQKAQVEKFSSNDDWICVDGSELYWWPKGNMSASELDLKGLEKVVGTMTIRTHGTIQRLVKKCFS